MLGGSNAWQYRMETSVVPPALGFHFRHPALPGYVRAHPLEEIWKWSSGSWTKKARAPEAVFHTNEERSVFMDDDRRTYPIPWDRLDLHGGGPMTCNSW